MKLPQSLLIYLEIQNIILQSSMSYQHRRSLNKVCSCLVSVVWYMAIIEAVSKLVFVKVMYVKEDPSFFIFRRSCSRLKKFLLENCALREGKTVLRRLKERLQVGANCAETSLSLHFSHPPTVGEGRGRGAK